MKILLLYPEFPDTFWSFKHALRFIRKKATLPPLGLLTVAAMLPASWEKRLVDLNVREVEEADLAWADCALISAMVVQREAARRLIGRCKAAGLRVIAGGPLFTGEPEAFPEVDHLVLNEAELTLAPFLADWQAGHPKRRYTSEEYADLEQTPVPLWELVDMRRYASMCLQYSRGCPYDCDFCNVTTLLGHRPRIKSPAQVIAELDRLYELGWRKKVFFVDDNLIGNKKALKTDLLPKLKEWQQGKERLAFYTEASVNLADDEELMRLMAQAGFDMVFIGIETPDELGLAECNKKQNSQRDLVETVKRIHRAGLQVQAGFIVGFDSDTLSIFQRQIEFIQQSGIVTAMVGLLQAPPGTRLYERLKLEGRLLGQMSGDNADGSTNIIPAMNLEVLREGYRKIMGHIYSPEHHYQRIRTFLREYRPLRARAPFEREHFMAFWRALYHLGIRCRGRFYYWRLLLWTFFHRPRQLPLAVTLCIYGYHFRRVSQTHIN
ncbi:MAG: DUF4070 domain-containing protein [Candidatus Latescibacteria bacterium]|nr:DUF4070 domain-containing protein [Candidatus Latescibacterota bacterium]